MAPGKDQGASGYEQGVDVRLDFFYEYVLRSLKIKSDKWQKMLNVEDYRNILHDFFDIPEKTIVVLSLNALGQLTAVDGYNQNTAMKMKSCYFIKKTQMTFGKEDATFREQLVYGDLAPQPLEALVTFIEEIVSPMITSEVTQTKWPEEVVADVVHHTEQVTGIIYTVQGQLKKKTLLHIPLELEDIERNGRRVQERGPAGMEPQFKKKLENLVTKWNQQITEVIEQDSSQVLTSQSHPTPFADLQFFEDRVADLQLIYDQLSQDKVQKCGKLLEDIDSVYWPSFRASYRNVVTGLAEAQDILAHLKPLRKYIEQVQSVSFDEVKEHLDPMMQCVCLIWGYSRHYCTPQRVIVLLQEICNLIIEMARGFTGGSSIFQVEPEEGLSKSHTVIDVMTYFSDLYAREKNRLGIYFPQEPEVKPEMAVKVKHWDFLPHLVFHRWDKFRGRMEQLRDLFETAVELCRLERMDFGGDGGKQFSSKVQKLHEEFNEFSQRFGSISYDCCDPEDNSFENDYREFQDKVKDIDQQLSAICAHAFDKCHTPEAVYKLIITLGQLVERPIIKEDFEPKFPKYVEILLKDFDRIQELLEQSVKQLPVRERQQIYLQFPPYSASIHWARDMQQRVDENMQQFQALNLNLDGIGDMVATLKQRHEKLSRDLKEFQDKTYLEWKQEVNTSGKEWLNEFLFTDGNELDTIMVNFRPELYGTMKEIKYMKVAGYTEIPELAQMLEQQFLTFRKYMISLENVSQSYNEILNITSDVELNLLRTRIDEIDLLIMEGRECLKWSDSGLEDYIKKLQTPVDTLLQKVRQAVDNVDLISKLVLTWVDRPLFERKDRKRQNFLALDEQTSAKKMKQYKEVEETSDKIQEIMARNKELLLDEDTVLLSWEDYLKHVESIIMHGLIRTVAVSMGYLLDHTDPAMTYGPLFEVIMELDTSSGTSGSAGPRFNPPLDSAQEENFLQIVENIMGDICHQATLVKRVVLPVTSSPSEETAAEEGEQEEDANANFLSEVEEMEDIADMKADIGDRIKGVISRSFEYITRFEPYAYLWEDDKKEYLSQFLQYGHQLTQEEQEQKATGEKVPDTPPTLDQFKEVIDKFESIRAEISKFPTEIIFEKWFRLSMTPFRLSLLDLCSSWALMFKQYLIDSVLGGLSGLDNFIMDAESGLTQPLSEGDLTTLISVMSWLQQVKERQASTDNMFEPVKEYIELLKLYDYELPESVFVQLEELPQKWVDTKKLAIIVKSQVAPLQAQEVSSIRRRIADFDLKQHAYRDRFRSFPFFEPTASFPYKELNIFHHETWELETEYQDICSAASLFEVHVPEPKALRQCRKEIRLAKQIWDYVLIVEGFIDDWKTTPWQNINVENMDLECKRMAKEVKAMDKDVKDWTIYLGLEAIIRNMVSSLKSVAELQNPSIRERHWEELMSATKIWPHLYKMLIIKFSSDTKTTLADLLALNLHNFEEEVKNVVDKAVKESSMEKTLKELDETWSTQEYNLELHQRTGTNLIRASEELIETLEDNQVQLQNIAMSKYIAFFQEEVEYWQNRLSICDQVLTALSEVQRTWCHLESIFIASDDIRINLPEDSARFDRIDEDFKKVLGKLYVSKNVVETTNQPEVLQELEHIQKELALCEKALADYLETKRLAFPRFYFVSSVDLLDILSNGNEPEMVCRHLTKLFDSMSTLIFKKDTKISIAMKAKDGEEVTFAEHCDCTGAVEVWLGRLEHQMRATIRRDFDVSVNCYLDKPREVWIQEFPAQTALCGTQIFWTSEVNEAFTKLEDGFENALKDYLRKQVNQLNTLIGLLIGSLSFQERQKIMTICTIDVHSRDVVSKLIQMRVESSQAFQWQSQLRHRWAPEDGHCYANICDAELRYWYEYLGNTPRLVITPLTDRCYITLTQALHLVMSAAPQGPAGTGKTETTKDLGRALGMMVYVFNCSEQMDYRSVGNIFKGLAQTGAWGCFDEFNRITVEVLSVVAVQVKSIQDAIRDKKKMFHFMGENIALVKTIGAFITMNPGYAGRSELPENLKVLFRPCAMCVPDFELICEIMLVAEGFQDARLLAKKFITLYTLCKELLSKQDHYDWGLRAIKSVLVVAGSLKRGDPGRPEDQVLMRALRDFNIPKIVTDDMPVFMGLIGDLFPALEVPRKRDVEFETSVRTATSQLNLQPEENFVLKVIQLEELLAVRHSVFIVGNAGTGKTQVWKTLFRTHQNMKCKPVFNDLNPKAVTNDELFGVINPATREWKDGILSVLMRDLANMSGDAPKWIILDGDIDPMWIESLNTVMDDNKVLTLASNERIALTKMMRLIFEIYTLKTATPATVSRAGILYINPQDLGWNPFAASWLESRENSAEKANLTVLFDKYVPTAMDMFKSRFKRITPIPEITHVELLCNLLDCILTPDVIPSTDCPKEWYELYFVFCVIWAFGSACFQDGSVDHRADFSKWFQQEFKFVKFPQGLSVFDVYIDPESKRLVPWAEKVPKFDLDPEIPLQATIVHTTETIRIKYFVDLLMEKGHAVMLVGTAGSGKSVLVGDKLATLPETHMVCKIPFNFYTTSEMLQRAMEKPLEKKAGRNFGPPGGKKLVYFIDDMNMPEVDAYGTVQPHTLIRQHMDYGHWYDRLKITLKDIHNVQYVACMNPTAGSFTINPRLQRHFAVFSVGFPGNDALQNIYKSILQQHLQSTVHKFAPSIQNICQMIVNTALALHTRVAITFLPTAVKFHYIFNLRDLSNIFQGLIFSTFDCLQNPIDLVRLWMHEASRVYGDKLVDDKDIQTFNKLLTDNVKKGFEDLDESVLMAKPLIYCHFAQGIGDPKYMPVTDFGNLQNQLVDALKSYNEFNSIMNLVLFEDAINYICRISRILESPRGNALCVGVGGSGKQSLARLAAFLSGLEVFQISLRKGYGLVDLRSDLAVLYIKAGQKNLGTTFLLTDAQVSDEGFLVVINDMLASGEVADLLPDDEVENIIASMRTEVKAVGLPETRENCWKFFIDRVRKMLKCILCFSPVGNTLRNRSRKFPAVINCTSIIWFQGWPHEALMSVSQTFVKDITVLPLHLHDPIASFMAFVHSSVNDMSATYLANEKRYNYTTPKSFLEQIDLYGKLVTAKNLEALSKADRLESGLTKLESCADQVEELKKVLAVQEVVLKEKNDAADNLIKIVEKETRTVTIEKENAAVEEKKVAVTAESVQKIQEICKIELEKAEPALQAAYAALNTLNKANLTELKTFTSPPPDAVLVISAVYVLWEGTKNGKIPKDKSWKTAKSNMMGDAQKFLDGLLTLDKESITPQIVEAMNPYITSPAFDPEKVRSKSLAAAGLCSYVLNVLTYNEVYQDVAPKRRALQEATDSLNKALERLAFLKSRIDELENRLEGLTRDFEVATEAKMKCQAEADRTAMTIDLANRLVGGLGAEKVRWIQNVANYRASTITIPGDMLLVTAFVSYVGCFTKTYRVELLEKTWMPYLKKMDPPIPMSDNVDPLSILTDDAEIASWNNYGLPSDRMSSENASILMNSQRWPLIIDPQLQGNKWIKSMHGANLKVIQLGQKGYLDVVEEAISAGSTVLIENLDENVDPVLEPLLARNLIKKGKAIKMGDREIDYNPDFRLILHTKLANPHYKPEMQAQTTLINFTVTRDGLEDQLLAEVVKMERPDLETQKSELTKQQNEFKILLKKLEDDLLSRLQSAEGNFLDDTALVENLETTKRTAQEVETKAKEAVITSAKIDTARELYRPAACRASLLYFILNDLNKINPIYQFSLKAFSTVFKNAILFATPSNDVAERILNLIDSITYSVWMYTTRGLFECDKLIFTTQMAFTIQVQKQLIHPKDLDLLLRFPVTPGVVCPVDFLTNHSWGAIKSLSGLDEYRNIDRDIEGAPKRWKKFVEADCPEREKMPQEWKSKTGIHRLCIMRALRPDRMTYAVAVFVEETLGAKYVRSMRQDFSKSFEESNNTTPIFFILSPGVDPLKDVEAVGKRLGYTTDLQNFHNISLGQGQEIVAEDALEIAADKGHWVILQNIHLVSRWLPKLEKKLEQNWEKADKKYRVFLSAEPASRPENHIIPQGILESSIKLTNEPPSGMLANIHKSLDNFTQETLETCSKELEFKAILFSLSYFHAVVAERRKFGTQGWNRCYPFNTGDLTISVYVLLNYLEANNKVPWEDLRYLFGEIMYGGHITDDFDRRLCKAYLEEYMAPELLDGEIQYAPNFPAPPSTDLIGYHQYIDDSLPAESPVLYGLHPNAEIGFLTATSENLFRTIFELQPRDSSGSGGQTSTKDEKIKQIIDDVLEKLVDPFNMSDIQSRAEDKTPYVIVALQECERMNFLTSEIRRSLRELDLGLKGELTISAEMEELSNSLFLDQVPASWTKRAYPSTHGLGSWYADLLLRARELETWSADFILPAAVWLGGFFNPQSFLTAIMQMTARKQELPLDKMCLQCEVTKKVREEFTSPPKDGAYVHGLYMEGARWDTVIGAIVESKLKELYPAMPVFYMKAITQDKADSRSMYECPVYKTRARGPTYVWTFNLRSKEKPSKWVLGGVALLLQV